LGFRYYYKFENRKTTARVQINYCATIYFMNKNINCEEGCDKVAELDELNRRVEKVLDLCQAAELTGGAYEWAAGYLDALREVAKLLKETK
jgi:hypothetical protein